MTDREKFEAAMISADKGYMLGGIFRLFEEWTHDELYGIWQESRKQALADALQGCQELLTVSGRQARDGDHFEIGREGGHMECITAIEALANPEGEQG